MKSAYLGRSPSPRPAQRSRPRAFSGCGGSAQALRPRTVLLTPRPLRAATGPSPAIADEQPQRHFAWPPRARPWDGVDHNGHSHYGRSDHCCGRLPGWPAPAHSALHVPAQGHVPHARGQGHGVCRERRRGPAERPVSPGCWGQQQKGVLYLRAPDLTSPTPPPTLRLHTATCATKQSAGAPLEPKPHAGPGNPGLGSWEERRSPTGRPLPGTVTPKCQPLL